MPREFIANVEEANNEVVRLDAQVIKLTSDLQASATKVTEMTQQLKDIHAAEQKALDDLKASQDSLKVAQDDAKSKGDKITELSSEVDKQKGLVTKAAAMAGVELKGDELVKTGITGKEGEDKGASNLTGLARAIAANKEQQSAKK